MLSKIPSNVDELDSQFVILDDTLLFVSNLVAYFLAVLVVLSRFHTAARAAVRAVANAQNLVAGELAAGALAHRRRRRVDVEGPGAARAEGAGRADERVPRAAPGLHGRDGPAAQVRGFRGRALRPHKDRTLGLVEEIVPMFFLTPS